MTWSKLRPWFRFRLDGDQIVTTGDLVQNESLSQMTQVVQVELLDKPELAKNQPMTIDYVDYGADTMVRQFAGRLNHVNTLSYPHSVTLTGVGVLTGLRLSPNSDQNLTDLTDGEAIMAILDYCNIPYDSDDIFDCEYILGQQIEVKWGKDQSGWDVVKELDLVFGTATIEIGDARVVRFPYDLAPDEDDIYRTFESGVDADFFPHERDTWDMDAIQNKFHVTGATWEGSGDAKCRYTPWARASAPNDDFSETNDRVKTEPFHSDFIQDESLAEAVATRLMRWYNRQPDRLGVKTLNDVNLCPGRVVGVQSPIYGIDLPVTAPYIITEVDRRGPEILLTCIGGIAGEVGTITHGVEKVCNKSTGDFDLPGDFSPPGVMSPPLVPIDPYFIEPLPCESGSFSTSVDIPDTADWTISGTVELGLKTQRLKVGVNTDAGEVYLTIAGASYYSGLALTPQSWELNGDGQYKHRWGSNPMHSAIDYTLQWDWENLTLSLAVQYFAGPSYSTTMVLGADAGTGVSTLRELTGTPGRSNEVLCVSEAHEGGGGGGGFTCFSPTEEMWDDLGNSVSFDPIGSKINIVDMSEDGEIIMLEGAVPRVFTEGQIVTWTLRADFTDPGDGVTDEPAAAWIMQQEGSPFNFAGVETGWSSVGNTGWIYLYGVSDFNEHDFLDADIYAGFDLTITWDPVHDTVSYTFVNDSYTISNSVAYGVDPDNDMNLKITFAAGATAIEMLTEQNEICVAPGLDGLCGIGDVNISGSSLWTFPDGSWVTDPDTGYMTATGASAEAKFGGIAMTTADDWEIEVVFQAIFSDVGEQDETNMVTIGVGASPSNVYRLLMASNFDQVSPAEETTFVGPNDASCWTPPGIGTTNFYGGTTVLPLNTDIIFNLAYDAGTNSLTATSSETGSQSVDAGSCFPDNSPEPVYVFIKAPFNIATSKDLIVVKSVKVLSTTAACS